MGTVGTRKATGAQALPRGRQRQLVVLGEETHVVGWGFMVMWSLRDLVGLLPPGSGAAGRPEGFGGGA